MATEAHERVVPASLRSLVLADRWKAILDAASRSGLSQSEFCRRQGISLAQYFWWKKKIGTRATTGQPPVTRRLTPAFLPVRLVERARRSVDIPRECAEGGALEIILDGGRRIVVRQGFDPETLRQVVETLEMYRC